MKKMILWFALAACGGVSKDVVRQETTTSFHNTVDVAAHVKQKCGDQADSDDQCKQAKEKLAQICASLDELAKKADGKGFDCAGWKDR
jgi:hypothetical protein